MRFKSLTFSHFLIALLFLIYVFLHFWKLDYREFGGDEASYLLAVIPAMKFYQNPQWLVSVFLYGHAPMMGLVEIPFLYIFGLRELWLYLPSVLFSLGLFWANYTILNKWFGKMAAIIGTVFLSVNGSIFVQRMIMGFSPFLFFSSMMIFYFYSFLRKKEIRKFSLALIFLFLMILSYAEAIIFIPILLFWLKTHNFLKKKKVLKKFLIFFIFLFLFFAFWVLVPFLAFRLGFISNLFDFGFFRIFKRASRGFALNLNYGFNMLKSNNSLLFTFLLLFGLIFSFFEKRSLFFWSFLLPPLSYFSLKQLPERHFFNYLNLIIILSAIGWLRLLGIFKNRLLFLNRLIFYFILISAVFINLKFLEKKEMVVKRGLKSTAYLVREKTEVCDKIYTDIEGSTTRLYFGRAYTSDPAKAKAVVLEKDLIRDEDLTKLFDEEYASFTNFMPYLKCGN